MYILNTFFVYIQYIHSIFYNHCQRLLSLFLVFVLLLKQFCLWNTKLDRSRLFSVCDGPPIFQNMIALGQRLSVRSERWCKRKGKIWKWTPPVCCSLTFCQSIFLLSTHLSLLFVCIYGHLLRLLVMYINVGQ